MKFAFILICLLVLTGCPEDPYKQPCTSDNSCEDGYFCNIKVEFYIMPNLGQCLPYVEVGEYCEENKQCLGSDVDCYDNTCQLKNKGQNCQSDDDCYFEESICAALTKGAQLTCLSRDEVLTTYCREDLLCGPDAYCIYEEDKDHGFCSPRIKPGETCENDSTCANTYRCRVAQDGQKRCVRLMGQGCDTTTQCQMGLTCIDDLCVESPANDMTPDLTTDMPLNTDDMSTTDMRTMNISSDMSDNDMETDG